MAEALSLSFSGRLLFIFDVAEELTGCRESYVVF
jgi:hypothetical protein